jgi:hypothetical protein
LGEGGFPAYAALAIAAGLPICATPSPDACAAEAPSLLFAVEDTLGPPPSAYLDSVLVFAQRLEIGEIVDRCIRHEEEVRERIAAHDWTELVKTVLTVPSKDKGPQKEIVIEEVRRISSRASTRKKAVLARMEYEIVNGVRSEREPEEDEIDGEPNVEVKYEDFDNLPFYLQDRAGYEFRILGREIVGTSVIYEVEINPKSDFEIAPRGRIWIDTSNFQILREEFDFEDRVPMPMLVKAIGPVVREREKVGDFWVVQRIMIRVDLRTGWMRVLDDDIPRRVEIVATSRDHHLEEKD